MRRCRAMLLMDARGAWLAPMLAREGVSALAALGLRDARARNALRIDLTVAS